MWSKSAIKAKQRKANMGSASKIVAKLNLATHPEGGFYSETFKDNSIVLSKSFPLRVSYNRRTYIYMWWWWWIMLFSIYIFCVLIMISDKVELAVSLCIYSLLPSRNVSSLHCIPCAKTWHFSVFVFDLVKCCSALTESVMEFWICDGLGILVFFVLFWFKGRGMTMLSP